MRLKTLNTAGNSAIIALIVMVFIAVGGIAFYAVSRHSSKMASLTAASGDTCLSQPLTEGAAGHCVKDAQTMLNWKVFGINQPTYIAVDGTFGASTTTVVKQLQTKLKLPASGTVDTTIWKVICQGGDAPSWWTKAAADAGCQS